MFFGDQAPPSSGGEGSSSSQGGQQNRSGSGRAGQQQKAGSAGSRESKSEATEGTGEDAKEKELVSLEFEVLDDEGLPRSGAVVCLLDGDKVIATKTVPSSGIVVFENLNDGEDFTVQVDDDPEAFHG